MPTAENIRAPKSKRTRRENRDAPAAPLNDDEQRVLSRGIAFLMFCAAAISFPTIYGLARLIGFDYRLAYLLPAAIDGYAVTSIWFGRRVLTTHPAAKAARRNSRLALAITIACNALYHLLTLGGDLIPAWARITLLVAVSSLPPFLVDRLLHLRALAAGDGATATVQAVTVQPKQAPAKNGASGQPSKTGVTVQADAQSSMAAPGGIVHANGHANGHATVQDPAPSTVHTDDQPSTADQDELIVQIGRTVYEALKTELGKRPPEEPYRLALAKACAPHIAAGRLPEKPYGDPSTSTAKRVRKDVETRFPELSPLHLIQAAS